MIAAPAVHVGAVAALARYPVKSMRGERLAAVAFADRGIVGDRAWAAYTADGGLGSGKTTRRFRRIEGLLDLRSRLDDGEVPVVTFRDGSERRADLPEASARLTEVLGQPLQLRPESGVPHHDDCPVHLVTTAALGHLGRLLGDELDLARFRANVVLDSGGDGFVEDGWHGRELALGDEVVLQLDAGMPRCVMVGMPQGCLPADSRVLRTLGQVHDTDFGLQARVVRGGTVRLGDRARLLGAQR